MNNHQFISKYTTRNIPSQQNTRNMQASGSKTSSSSDMASLAAHIGPVSRRYRRKDWGNGKHNYNLRKTAQRKQGLLDKAQISGVNGEENEANISPNSSWDQSPDNSFSNSQYQVGSLSSSSEVINLVDQPFTSTRRLSLAPLHDFSMSNIHVNCFNDRSNDYLQRSYSNSGFEPSSSSECISKVSSIDPSLLKLETPMMPYNDEHSITMSLDQQ